jgi:RNA polymerase sigma factor (sigma-70 family)
VGVELTDEELLRAHITGDRSAFRLLFARYSRRIFAILSRSGFSATDAEDIVQKTFLQVHQSRRDFDPGRSFRPWLWTIAYNLMRSTHRGNVRVRARERRAEGMTERAHPGPDAGHTVRSAIARLSLDHQEVVLLHWYEGLTFPEIAHVLDASESAVRVRAHRAYQRLRELLVEPRESEN